MNFTTPYHHHLHSNHTLTWEYQTRSYQKNSPPINPGRKICKKSRPAKIREGANQVPHLQRPRSHKPSHERPNPEDARTRRRKGTSRITILENCKKPTNPPLLAACSPPPGLISHPEFTESKKGSKRKKNKNSPTSGHISYQI